MNLVLSSLLMLRAAGFMNETSYDEEKNVVSVGPGGHWQDVYDTLIPYGLAVAGYVYISLVFSHHLHSIVVVLELLVLVVS